MSTNVGWGQTFHQDLPGLLVALTLVTLPLAGLAHALMRKRLGAALLLVEGLLALGSAGVALGAYVRGMSGPDAPEPFLLCAVFLSFALSWGLFAAFGAWRPRRGGVRAP